MKKSNVKLVEKLDKLCSLYEYGSIQLSAFPVDFIERVYTEIVELRKFKEKIYRALKICDNSVDFINRVYTECNNFKGEGNNEKEN